MIERHIKLPYTQKSIFLFGPRQVGKSTYVRHILANEKYLEIDLLRNKTLMKYASNPDILISEVEYILQTNDKYFIFIDEIQKCPKLLDEIHYLLEAFKGQLIFILTGSSARKLKRSSVNMLGGRAWQYALFPLTHEELGDFFQLDMALLKGTLPPTIKESKEDAYRTLRAYVQTYLKDEILDEAITRNISAFSHFFDIAADQSGQIVNYSTLAQDTGVSSKTIKGYYEILVDTLVAIKLEPYLKSARKRIIKHPKYYLFDIGVINACCGRFGDLPVQGTTIYGILFEHFIILETFRLIHYYEKAYRLYHWRSANGAEVDLILKTSEALWAIEIKSARSVKSKHLKGLKSFIQDYPDARPVCVCTSDTPYMAGNIKVLPWKQFFSETIINND
jgi:predicted AAA+ superfamily ATPase